MSYTFSELQAQVKRRGTRGQSGTEFDQAAKDLVNSSLFAIARATPWRPLRRQEIFDTVAEYTTGTMSATNGSKSFTGTGLLFVTNDIRPGRRFSVTGSGKIFTIETVTGEDAFTATLAFDGTTASGLSHTVFGQEEYNLPIQTGRVGFLWHENFGFPFVLRYIPSQNFFETSIPLDDSNTPTHYRMWGEDWVDQQPRADSVLRVFSSDSADQSRSIVIHGTVSGIPDREDISTDGSDGTTPVSGSKTFDAGSIERVSKSSSTTGRITVDSNGGTVNVATLPVGNATAGIMFKKILLWPYPQDVFPINVWYYKDPWRLVDGNDIHELGADFDEAVILLAVAKIKYENSQKEGDKWFAMYKDELRSLRKLNGDKLDYVPDLRRPRRSGVSDSLHPHLSFSQLGGLFGPMGHLPF